MKKFAIAIDGPAGSGKSTVAKILAKQFKIVYIDTGAMYRTVALYCMRNGIDTKDSESVSKVIDSINIDIMIENGIQKIFLDDENVTEKIRTQEIGQGASDVGLIFSVRKKLVEIQRKLAETSSVVMDGRDIGTNVLKDALVKIYLNASVDERTERRCGELRGLGVKFSYDDVREQILLRDRNDMTREYNPLTKAPDAVEIDSTNMTVEQVVDEISDIINERLGE